MDDVRVSYLDIADLQGDAEVLARAWLRGEEHARFTRYRHDADRLMFLAGRVMARSIVGAALGCPPASWRWREGPHGRPEIDEPGTGLRFNIAHSAGLVVCAIERRARRRRGRRRSQRPETDRRSARYCSPAEAADIEHKATPNDRFRSLDAKEAYLKARGLGTRPSF